MEMLWQALDNAEKRALGFQSKPLGVTGRRARFKRKPSADPDTRSLSSQPAETARMASRMASSLLKVGWTRVHRSQESN